MRLSYKTLRDEIAVEREVYSLVLEVDGKKIEIADIDGKLEVNALEGDRIFIATDQCVYLYPIGRPKREEKL